MYSHVFVFNIKSKVYNLQMLIGFQGNRDNVSPVTKRNLISVASINSNSTQNSISIICEKQNWKLFKKELPNVFSFQRRNLKFAPSRNTPSCHYATACKESTYTVQT